jgi:hypothetical protein
MQNWKILTSRLRQKGGASDTFKQVYRLDVKPDLFSRTYCKIYFLNKRRDNESFEWKGVSRFLYKNYSSHSFTYFICSRVTNTRWFKHDADKLWLVYTQSVPVIFEPPCIRNFFLNTLMLWLYRICKGSLTLHLSLISVQNSIFFRCYSVLSFNYTSLQLPYPF